MDAETDALIRERILAAFQAEGQKMRRTASLLTAVDEPGDGSASDPLARFSTLDLFPDYAPELIPQVQDFQVSQQHAPLFVSTQLMPEPLYVLRVLHLRSGSSSSTRPSRPTPTPSRPASCYARA
jgi:hypothetical protein